jgi:hypothetical protein
MCSRTREEEMPSAVWEKRNVRSLSATDDMSCVVNNPKESAIWKRSRFLLRETSLLRTKLA